MPGQQPKPSSGQAGTDASGSPALPASICSVQDLRSLVVELRAHAKWLSHAAVKQRAGLPAATAAEQPALSAAASQLLGNHQPQDSQHIEALITALAGLEASAPQITITLAAPAHGELRQALAAWCRTNIAPGALISFRFNATILGGMVVRYGSHVHDWSFRRQILANRAAFPEVLRRV